MNDKRNDPRYTTPLTMPRAWRKTKNRKNGEVSGFTFRGETGLLYLRLGPPQLADPNASTPQYRYSFELSHTHHLTPGGRDRAILNDRVFFAQGVIVLFTPDPKPEHFERRMSELLEEYNILLLRVGRIFEIPKECLRKKDSPLPHALGGYTLLGIKIAVNNRGCDGWSDAEAEWGFTSEYMIRQAHMGFRGSKQREAYDPFRSARDTTSYVGENELGREVVERTAGPILTSAVEGMIESTVAHLEYLRGLTRTATDLSLAVERRAAAVERLRLLIDMKTYSYGIEEGFHFLATPREPVDKVFAAIQSLITVMPEVETDG